MCGIIGYTGTKQAVPVLISGLSALEYRGYDSAGISVYEDGIITIKTEGRLKNLTNRIKAGRKIKGHTGIGHTRWATHGEPSERNAHPHLSSRLSLVHNGIIENYQELEQMLSAEGYRFRSETDTEAAAHLIDYFYKQSKDPVAALHAAARAIRGSFAFAVMFKGDRENLYAVRSGSPLICADTPNGSYLASDIPAILPFAKEYYQLPENVVAVLSPKGINFFTADGAEIIPEKSKITWSVEAAKKCGYNHFMLKEINEQAEALRNTVLPRLRDGIPYFDCDILDRNIEEIGEIKIIGCGTAMHAGLVGKNVIERFARIPVSVEIASEFRYGNPILRKDTLVILISQSGETADTIAALELAKSAGAKTLAIVNVLGSTISRLADYVIYTWAGPEISVASTKAYTVQCAVLYQIAFKLALVRHQISEGLCRDLCERQANSLPAAIDAALKMSGRIKRLSEKIAEYEDVFFIGRGIDAEICKEGSLKLKEISYIHSESYPAGELKHGTISLIDANVPVIAVITVSQVLDKTISNVREVKSRGATVFSVCAKAAAEAVEAVSDYTLVLPETDEIFAPVVAIIVLQILAYYTAVARNCDVDKPRNLAKSVTVE
ncbi:MAG: glutamine--fructose-6-phosphate transaminase (isomerizing) [Clostridia bacterium]|nr:glutamine--fructose-6-phosphate transaminase (isomerizing) [Clostridia bacterium]